MSLKQQILSVGTSVVIGATGLYAQNECNTLSISNGDEKTTEIIKINNGKGQIGEYTVQIKDKVIKVFIPDSDSIVTNSELINNGNGKCRVGKLLSVK